MGYALLPKLPKPEKIAFGPYQFVDYLAQVEPLDRVEMNNMDKNARDTLCQAMWYSLKGKAGRIRYEAAATSVADQLKVPRHEAVFQMESYINSPGAKFVRLRIHAPHHSDPAEENFVNWEVFGSRTEEVENGPEAKVMGQSKRQRILQDLKATLETQSVREEFRARESSQVSEGS